MSGNNLEAVLSIGSIRYGDNVTEEEINVDTRLKKLEDINAGVRLDELEKKDQKDRVDELVDKVKNLEDVNADSRLETLENINTGVRLDEIETALSVDDDRIKKLENLKISEAIKSINQMINDLELIRFSPDATGSKFIENSEYPKYKEYTANKYEVTIKVDLMSSDSTFTGSEELVFTINTDYIPRWAIPNNYVEFTQECSYRKGAETIRDNCRVRIYDDGRVVVDGMQAVGGDITRVDLFVDLRFKRN